MKKPYIKTIKNELTLVVVPADSPSVTSMVLVGAGSLYEPEKLSGISHFLEHMCFKGTKTRTGKEIMRYLDGLGAETNAFTSHELTGYYVKSPKKHWKKGLSVISDIYQNSQFPEDEIEKEKGVIAGEIAMYDDMPMYRVHDNFYRLGFEGEALGQTILGTKDHVESFTRQDFIEYQKAHYHAGNTVVVLSGGIDKKEAATYAEKLFADLVPEKKEKLQKKAKLISRPLVHGENRNTDQTHIVFGFDGLAKGHKDMYAMNLLGALLGGGMSSRLFERLREDLGVGYYVRASHKSYTQRGVFEISCGIDSTRLEEVLREIINELDRIKKEGIEESELKRIREYLTGNFQMGLESSDDIAYFYGAQQVTRKETRTPAKVLSLYKQVTVADIKRLAKRLFAANKAVLAVVGPDTDEGKLKKIISELL